MADSTKELGKACGTRGRLRLDVSWAGSRGSIRYDLGLPFALVGRENANHLVLDHEEVERRHFYLQLVEGKLFGFDLSRTSGVGTTGRLSSQWLRPDQSLALGPFRIRYSLDDDVSHTSWTDWNCVPAPSDPQAPGSEQLSPLALEFLNGRARSPLWQMKHVLSLVGKSRQCKVRLLDQKVSRFHCSLLRTLRGAWVIDLQRGIRVNGRPVSFARLNDGDILGIGNLEIRVHCDPARGEGLVPPLQFPFPAPGQMLTAGLHEAAETPDDEETPSAEEFTLPQSPTFVVETGSWPLAVRGGGALVPSAFPGSQLQRRGEEASLLQIVLQMSLAQQEMVRWQHHTMTAQRDMFDQYQQNLLTILQVLTSTHRDSLEQIRGDLARLEHVTRELQALNVQRPNDTAAPEPLLANPAKEVARPEANGTPQPKAPPIASPSPAPPPVSQPETAPREGRTVPGPSFSPPDPEVAHAWLHSRLSTLQEEQRSLWQKVVSFLGTRSTSA